MLRDHLGNGGESISGSRAQTHINRFPTHNNISLVKVCFYIPRNISLGSSILSFFSGELTEMQIYLNVIILLGFFFRSDLYF